MARKKTEITTKHDDLIQSAKELIRQSYAPNTIEAYRSDWRAFERWCSANHCQARPAEASALVLYLTELHKKGRSVSTIARTLTTIRIAHRDSSYDPTDAPIVVNLLKGIRRSSTRPVKKARFISVEELETMAGAVAGDKPRQIRDRAILLLGWAAALRSSELLALDWSDIRSCPEGVIVRIRTSKTDQESQGAELGIPWAVNPALCSVRALEALRQLAQGVAGAGGKLEDDPIFLSAGWGGNAGDRLVDGRAGAQTVTRAVRRAATLAKLPDPLAYSAHSLRRGLATAAAKKGVPDRVIMRHGRWRSRATVDGYVQAGTIWTDNPLKGLL